MVNLPAANDYVHEYRRRPRSHHKWGLSLTPQERAAARQIPRTLADVDVLVKRAVSRITRHSYEADEQRVYTLLREQYDLPLRMYCTTCHGVHGYYEAHDKQ